MSNTITDKTDALKNEIASKKAEMTQTKTVDTAAKKIEQAKAKADKELAKAEAQKIKDAENVLKAEAKAKAKVERELKAEQNKIARMEAEKVRKAEAEVRKAEKLEATKADRVAKLEKARLVIQARDTKLSEMNSRLQELQAETDDLNVDSLRASASAKDEAIENEILIIRSKRLDGISRTEKQIGKLNTSLAAKYSDMDAWEAKRAEERTKRQSASQAEIDKKLGSKTKRLDSIAKLKSNIEKLSKTQATATERLNKVTI